MDFLVRNVPRRTERALEAGNVFPKVLKPQPPGSVSQGWEGASQVGGGNFYRSAAYLKDYESPPSPPFLTPSNLDQGNFCRHSGALLCPGRVRASNFQHCLPEICQARRLPAGDAIPHTCQEERKGKMASRQHHRPQPHLILGSEPSKVFSTTSLDFQPRSSWATWPGGCFPQEGAH